MFILSSTVHAHLLNQQKEVNRETKRIRRELLREAKERKRRKRRERRRLEEARAQQEQEEDSEDQEQEQEEDNADDGEEQQEEQEEDGNREDEEQQENNEDNDNMEEDEQVEQEEVKEEEDHNEEDNAEHQDEDNAEDENNDNDNDNNDNDNENENNESENNDNENNENEEVQEDDEDNNNEDDDQPEEQEEDNEPEDEENSENENQNENESDNSNVNEPNESDSDDDDDDDVDFDDSDDEDEPLDPNDGVYIESFEVFDALCCLFCFLVLRFNDRTEIAQIVKAHLKETIVLLVSSPVFTSSLMSQQKQALAQQEQEEKLENEKKIEAEKHPQNLKKTLGRNAAQKGRKDAPECVPLTEYKGSCEENVVSHKSLLCLCNIVALLATSPLQRFYIAKKFSSSPSILLGNPSSAPNTNTPANANSSVSSPNANPSSQSRYPPIFNVTSQCIGVSIIKILLDIKARTNDLFVFHDSSSQSVSTDNNSSLSHNTNLLRDTMKKQHTPKRETEEMIEQTISFLFQRIRKKFTSLQLKTTVLEPVMVSDLLIKQRSLVQRGLIPSGDSVNTNPDENNNKQAASRSPEVFATKNIFL